MSPVSLRYVNINKKSIATRLGQVFIKTWSSGSDEN